MASARSGAGFRYRPALDGMRAVAVLAVMAFHLGFVWAEGAFIGVDVFFVLSGYLITSLLLTERARTGRIDLSAFWVRRARRLLPALGVVGAAVLVSVPFTMRNGELEMVRGDGIATVLYVANWHFASTGEAYFALFEDPSPLRHMWSLAVEEQFYLAWPLLVAGLLALAARRRPGLGHGTIAALCVAGIVVSATLLAQLYTPGADPSRAYYGTDARIHGLLVGALLAVVLHGRAAPGPRAVRLARSLGPAAVVVLAVCVAVLDSHEAPYYRGGSLVVALATGALILASEWSPDRHRLTRVLSLPPLRYVGRLSYSLYLWHWPVFIWMSADLQGPPNHARDLLAVAVTFAAAAACYHLVELPVRRGLRHRPRPVPARRPAHVALRPTAPEPLHLR